MLRVISGEVVEFSGDHGTTERRKKTGFGHNIGKMDELEKGKKLHFQLEKWKRHNGCKKPNF
jgi:hypothetical protein